MKANNVISMSLKTRNLAAYYCQRNDSKMQDNQAK